MNGASGVRLVMVEGNAQQLPRTVDALTQLGSNATRRIVIKNNKRIQFS